MEDTALSTVDTLILKHSFRDIDELNQAAAGWQVDFQQLDTGPFECDLTQVFFEDVLLSHTAFDRKIDQQGAAPAGSFTFAVPKPGAPRIVWRSRVVRPGSMIIYRPGSEIDGASRPGFEVATVSIAREVFEAACCAADRSDLIDLANRVDLVTPHPAVLTRFLAAMQLTARLAAEASLRKDVEPAVVDSLSVLTSLALETLASSRPAPAQRIHPGRTRALCRAFDYIRENREEPITVQSLCEAAEVSERTLQYVFRERFDVTPKQFVMSHRLNSVRRELRRFGPSVRIYDIANRWGVWHMGQFAKDYKRQFGELPSGTLSRVAPPGSSP